MTEERIDEGIERHATSDAFTDAEMMAIIYAERMGSEPEAIDEAFYQELARYYSVEEIVEPVLQASLRQELLGRLDGPAFFRPLVPADIRLIAEMALGALAAEEVVMPSSLRSCACRAARRDTSTPAAGGGPTESTWVTCR